MATRQTGGAGDQRHMFTHIIRKASAKRTQRAGVSIDHARRHLAAGVEAEFGRSLGRKRADGCPRHHGCFGQACPLFQIAKPGKIEIIRLPAGIFLRQKIPLRRLRAI